MNDKTLKGTKKLLATLLFVLLMALLASIPVSGNGPASPQADGIDEIVVVGNDGYVYAYNYQGEEVFKSSEAGWTLVTTGDLNNDGDQEIIAANGSRVKVYDPQIVGEAVSYDVTYSGNGTFTKIGVGKLVGANDILDIALIRSLGSNASRIVIYQIPDINPVVNVQFSSTDWSDFAIGDYDADDDDDFALIYWNDGYPTGFKNWFELRKGHDPNSKLQDTNKAGRYGNSRWYDVVAGNFYQDSENAQEWVGTQSADRPVAVQRWDYEEKDIDNVWSMGTTFEFLTATDFRNDGDVDQIGMLRNTSSGVSLQFARNGFVWASLGGLGGGWLNMASGNVDEEATFKEAVILRSDIIRIFLQPQAGTDATSAYLDCNTPGNCLDINGSFNGALAVGDLGESFSSGPPPPKPGNPYVVTPTYIFRTAGESELIANGQFNIYGEVVEDVPIKWEAAIIPAFDAKTLQEITAQDSELKLSVTGQSLQYESDTGTGTLPLINWMALNKYSGVATSTVTASFSDTFPGSPLYNTGAHKAIIFVWRTDVREDRFRYVDVTVLRPSEFLYLPLTLK